MIVSDILSQKPYELMMLSFEAEVVRHEEFGGALRTEAFAQSGIEVPSHGIGLLVREAGPIGPLREVLAEQSVGVVVDVALPRAVRVSEINGDTGQFGRAFVPGVCSHSRLCPNDKWKLC